MQLSQVAGPTAAERARTIFSRAMTSQVRWLSEPSPDAEELGEWSGAGVRIVGDHCGSADARPVAVEVAEVATLPVRERILARVRLVGYAAPEHDAAHDGSERDGSQQGTEQDAGNVLMVVPAAISLQVEGENPEPVSPEEFLTARPDALAEHESGMLSHIDHAHREFVDVLTALVEPRLRQGVATVWPLRLDRYGIVLRLEYASRHRDVALPFQAEAETPEEGRAQLMRLAHIATLRRHSCRPSGPLVE